MCPANLETELPTEVDEVAVVRVVRELFHAFQVAEASLGFFKPLPDRVHFITGGIGAVENVKFPFGGIDVSSVEYTTLERGFLFGEIIAEFAAEVFTKGSDTGFELAVNPFVE